MLASFPDSSPAENGVCMQGRSLGTRLVDTNDPWTRYTVVDSGSVSF